MLLSEPGMIEERFMEAADGTVSSICVLNQFLESVKPEHYSSWPGDVQAAWSGGTELFTDAVGRLLPEPAVLQWLRLSSAAGYDSAVFRDALASGARAAFPDYLDPAGLISALGIHDAGVTTETIAARWDRFEHLFEGARCCHSAYGAGVVEEIDALTSEVRVRFEKHQVLPLDVFLDSVKMVRRGSALDRLLTEGLAALQNEGKALMADLSASLIPTGGNLRFFRKCLVPVTISERDFKKVFTGGGTRSTREAVASGRDRLAADARSIQELAEILKSRRKFEPGDEDTANIERLLTTAGQKPDQAELLRDVLVGLWHFCPGATWLSHILRDDLSDASAWSGAETFVELTDGVAGKSVAHWLAAAATAVGEHRFFSLVVRLPLRLWSSVEQVVASCGMHRQQLIEAAVTGLQSANATADMALWLWRSKAPERQLLRDVSVIMKALATPTKGAFSQANRDLRKLFVTNEELHAFLVDGRSTESRRALVRAVEHSAVLDSGERQSMLVRLVRTFPELRPIIEKRSAPTRRKAMARITSIRSYDVRRLELEEIVNAKIPANSRTIATAREHGDLRENAEYKAAKDEQAYLTARRNELETDLDEVRAYDFSLVKEVSQVVPGCRFVLEMSDGSRQVYFLLGLWDSIPERNMLSYETPLGEAVLASRAGDQVDLPNGQTATIAEVSVLPGEVTEWLNEHRG